MPSLAVCRCVFRLMRRCFLGRWICLLVSERLRLVWKGRLFMCYNQTGDIGTLYNRHNCGLCHVKYSSTRKDRRFLQSNILKTKPDKNQAPICFSFRWNILVNWMKITLTDFEISLPASPVSSRTEMYKRLVAEWFRVYLIWWIKYKLFWVTHRWRHVWQLREVIFFSSINRIQKHLDDVRDEH